MGGMEFNKIFAALLIAGIVASLSGFIAKKLVQPEELEENAFKIEIAEAGGTGAAPKVELPDPILGMIAEADIVRGQKVAKACAACHVFDKGGPNGVGPNLWNTVGKTKQHAANFSYSGALAANGGPVWTYAELNHFLWKPKKYAPGTKMTFIGVKKTQDRAALIAWLRTLSDNPAPLPSQAEIDAEKAALAPPAEEPVAAPAEPAAPAEEEKEMAE